MKKIITVLLSVLLIAGLFTSCNGDTDELLFLGGNNPVTTFTVTFNSNGGSEVESQTVKEGECAFRPENDPERKGFDFVNWCSDEALNVEYNFNTPVTSDITLYANWTPAPFKLVAQEDGVTVKIKKSNATDAPEISLVYRQTNGTGWTEWTDYTWVSNEGYKIQLNNAEEVEIKAKTTNESFGNSSFKNNYFVLTGKVAARGNIMFLLDSEGKSTEVPEYCFYGLFQGCNTLTEAPALPATTLADSCYLNMFALCSALTKAPEQLPALTLANDCYNQMFAFCSSLTTAPALPATTLANHCYCAMFSDCTALITAPELPATTLADYCYAGMFQRCTALETAPELPATTLAGHCYGDMFENCSSLKTAPELPATTLADYCYQYMFKNCTALTNVPMILPALTLANGCYQGMFSGCTALITAPELPAATLVNHCYDGLFQYCNSLNYIKMLATDISATDCLKNWVDGVTTSSGTFVKNAGMTTNPPDSNGIPKDNPSGIPSGWTVQDNP